MRNRRPSSSPVERLRTAIDCLPVATRQAMLAGVLAAERVVVGAYTDGRGGVCPMLAAHRGGAPTDFLSFARAWDRFACSRGASRMATKREVGILVAHLRASLDEADGLELDRAIAEHRSLMAAARRRNPPRSDEYDPRGEVRARRLTRPRLRPARALPSAATRQPEPARLVPV